MYHKPSNKEFRKAFDSIAENYDQVTNSYAVKKRIEFIQKYAKGRCLEVGAGTGEISKALLSKHKVVATDISPKMVNEIKKKLKIKAYVTDAQKLPFDDSSFDTIIAAEVIYYLDDPERFIQESHRTLKKKGRILLTSASKITEFYDRIRAFLRKLGFSSMYFADPNRQFMTTNKIKKLLEEKGFKIKNTEMAIILPFKTFDRLNRLLEKTLLKHLCSFIFIWAEKLPD